MKQKLDIFKLLSQVSMGHRDFIDTLTEDELKEFSPFVANMWISNPDEFQIERTYYTNILVNEHIFRLASHKKLLFKIMCLSQNFGKTRYTFPKAPKHKTKKTCIDITMEFYDVSKSTAQIYIQSLSKDTMIDLAEQLGYDKPIIKKIEIEYKTRVMV